MLGVLTHSQRRLKTPQFCSIFFDLSKSHQSRATTGLKRHFQSASYPLSINTRNAHESSSKIACFLFDFLRAKTTTTKAFSRQNTHRLFHRFCEQQKPSCRWLASLRDTNHLLQCFFRAVVKQKIGTHAEGAGPHDFLFDEFGNGEQYAEFFHVPRSVGRVSGRSPDQVGNV